jgi:hypothetical protein
MPDFKIFLEFFPEVELPVTLGEFTHLEFEKENEILPVSVIKTFLEPIQEVESDEHTEYIPGFRIKDTFGFYALVYWKASLMGYHYILSTFTQNGEFIDQRVLAGTLFDGRDIFESVATIGTDWEIVIVSGKKSSESGFYDPAGSTTIRLELLPEGAISHIGE